MPPAVVERLEERISELAGAPAALERPKDPSHGDFATSVALRTAKAAARAPRELADELAQRIAAIDDVASAEVAGPGFVNVRLADAFFVAALGEMGEGYGGGFADQPQRVQVEMVSANPTGPIVVSAARNGAYGDCVARLLAFGGHTVEREYYYNDAGAQIDRFRASVEAVRRGEPVPEDGYRGDYVAELAAEGGDPVQRMLASIERTMERFRIHFDGWTLQSELEQRLGEFLPRLDTYERDGALWARSSAYGDEQDWVLVRSTEKGGTPTYRAADVVYLVDKLERGFDRAIYVLGADHHATARWYAAIARMLGYDPERVEVLLYQFVHLASGGESAKASKRAGNVVFLDDLMDEIGVDASRWYLVNRGPDQTIEIDLDLAGEKSAKNPVYYVQYAHARIAAILRNAGASPELVLSQHKLAGEEKELIKRLTDFPVTVREAAERRGPQLVPAYAIRLADDFHRFYHECRVLGDPAQEFRLALCRATQQVIARCLDLVGVDAPERM
ncbi:MAG TPA: arginine--tRNA ligase [Gaiellaceae bacterium]|nr:arginine--tRNA ligase [Gaiellaceae bacterium]